MSKLVRFLTAAHTPAWGMLHPDHTVQQLEGDVYSGGYRFGQHHALADITLLPPAQPSKIICVGRNYTDHIAEMGNTLPTPGVASRSAHPSDSEQADVGLFLKTPNTLATTGHPLLQDDYGPGLPYPEFSNSLHFEGELAVVMARGGKCIPQDQALSHVLGYTIAMDWSARDKQQSDLQWVRAKSSDGFLPLGPWVETDLDPNNLRLSTTVNGVLKQNANTSQMVFSVAHIIAYVSKYLTLEPGDLLITGTPAGVGAVAAGDKLEVSIEGIGVLKTRVL